ncbi:AMP-binding protein [Polaribacter batillariae]|uniref:AMP-binding protein n=1 Tax=Polaribacter batillariae TaxID=2808900 RepID=A0ABX7ST08_9FLAO|nr:AMP-binding protein [Polaribacter batillariae]QTD37390.1 AMP-binding protein [Polaribacter batillariae]
MAQNKLHTCFQLNNNSFSNVNELLYYAQNSSKEIYPFLKEWFSNKRDITVQTSGSTGAPKAIQLQKEHVVNSALTTGNYFSLAENTTALLCLPVAYIAGKLMLIRAITLGWHLDVVQPDSNPLKDIFKEYDFSAMVPLQVENSLDKLPQIKKLIVGGGVVSKKLQDKLQTLSTEVFATYGMTETITHIAVKKLNKLNFDGVKYYISRSFRAQSSGYFSVLPNITIYKDERNCLVIKAPKVSKEVIFTNDVVRLISDTQFEWLGRLDHVINSGGVKLHPEKIEEKFSAIIKNRFFVTGISDEKLGEKLILVVELESSKASGFKSILFKKIKNLQSLSKFEIPKEIYFVEQFIETETGKIQRSKTLLKARGCHKSKFNGYF